VTGCCEYGNEPSGSDATELIYSSGEEEIGFSWLRIGTGGGLL
jgi:hypothetical protein